MPAIAEVAAYAAIATSAAAGGALGLGLGQLVGAFAGSVVGAPGLVRAFARIGALLSLVPALIGAIFVGAPWGAGTFGGDGISFGACVGVAGFLFLAVLCASLAGAVLSLAVAMLRRAKHAP